MKIYIALLFIIYLIWKFHYQDSLNLIATIQQDSLPIQKYSIYQLIRLIRGGKRAFSWSQPFINLSRRGKIFHPAARASCITLLYPSSQKLFTRALARSVYSFANEKIRRWGIECGERIFEDLINYRSRCESHQPIPWSKYSLRLRLRYERESLPFEALPKLCLHTLHLRCRDLSTYRTSSFLSSARSSGWPMGVPFDPRSSICRWK